MIDAHMGIDIPGRAINEYDSPVPRKPDPNLTRAFGQAVAVARARQRLSQEELGRRAHPPIERAHLGAIERGEREPGLSVIVRLAGALDMQPGRLLDAMDEEKGR
jgi:ribosome-binding protein aMBF1 (putative translation factor)